ncbi:hypothetical protein ACKWTF_005807 [Chironomus riparius]
MTEEKPLIKFLSVPSRRTVKEFVGSICRKLNFTRSNYKDINGLFVENLQNNRYHLHVYTRNDEFIQGLKNIGKSTSDPNYMSLEINRTNHLFLLPPYNNSSYKLFPMERNCEQYEKVIEFSTGINQTIMDILLLIDTNKYKIKYIVCTRTRSYVEFFNGTDAMEILELLRTQQYNPKFSSCYAKIIYVENNVRLPESNPPQNNNQSRNNTIPPLNVEHNIGHENIVRRENYVDQNQHEYVMRRRNYVGRQQFDVMRHNNNYGPYPNIVNIHDNFVQRDRNVFIPRHIPRFFPRHIPRYIPRHNVMRQRNNMRGARFVRVMLPDDMQQNNYGMHLIRRF